MTDKWNAKLSATANGNSLTKGAVLMTAIRIKSKIIIINFNISQVQSPKWPIWNIELLKGVALNVPIQPKAIPNRLNDRIGSVMAPCSCKFLTKVDPGATNSISFVKGGPGNI